MRLCSKSSLEGSIHDVVDWVVTVGDDARSDGAWMIDCAVSLKATKRMSVARAMATQDAAMRMRHIRHRCQRMQ